MANPEGMADFDKSLRELNTALDALTATLGEVRGCEYPRLIAREIQALIVACVAHERAKHETANGAPLTMAGATAVFPAVGDAPTTGLLQSREAELVRLRDLIRQGVETIEAHTLTDSDGTAVMLHGHYQCINAAALDQWLERAAATLQQSSTTM